MPYHLFGTQLDRVVGGLVFLVRSFWQFHNLCIREAKRLVGLLVCADSFESSLLVIVVSTRSIM